MSFTYAGVPGIHPLDSGVRYNAQTGRVLVERYSGNPQDVRGFQNLLERKSVPYTINDLGAAYPVIEIERPQSANPTTEVSVMWDLDSNEALEDLLDHWSLKEAGVSAYRLGVLGRLMQRFSTSQSDEYNAIISALTTAEVTDSLPAGTLTNIFIEHAKGVTGWKNKAYVVRRTAILGSRFPAQYVVPNELCVYETSADLASFEAIPATRKWTLPLGQWLKELGDFKGQRDGTTIYTQEWTYAAAWSETLYRRATL